MTIPSWIKDGRFALAVGALSIGVGIGTYSAPFFRNEALPKDIREFNSSYHFINPLLACGADEDLDASQARALKASIQDSISAHTSAGDITDASVYVRDLNNGPWLGINYSERFSPSSLLKVPLAMSIYKRAEDEPSFLEKKIAYTGTEVQDQQYYPATVLSQGEYTVAELVQQMLESSDNNAANVLAQAVGSEYFKSTYSHLGIETPPTEGSDYTTTTHEYASFLRVLYSATYVSDDSSEEILKILSETSFKNGLVAGVPAGTMVAHKFGEHALSNSTILQLHDCGIVYAPKHPYVICVMTKGTNFDLLAKTIADISRTAYQSTQ
jgi:beta-lactamase class A